MVTTVRFGIMTPIVSRNPRHHPPPWEADGTIEDLAVIATRAEALGYDFMTFPEHVAIPEDVAAVRGGTYWAPLPTMGYLAACTERIRLATYVLVLGYHHPMELAKSYGTLDRVCGGRVVLGVGVGSLEQEFDLLGVPFAGRGERSDATLEALRVTFSNPHPPGWVLDPCGLDRPLTIWVGGRTGRSLRRAVTLGDGWAPFGLPPARVSELLAGVARPAGFDLVLHPEPPVAPADDPAGTREAVERYAATGATHLVFRFRQQSRAELLDQMEALVELFPESRVLPMRT